MSSSVISSLFEKYQNVLLCLGKEYRNWDLLESPLDEKEFEKVMGSQKYVMHLTYNPEDERFVFVVLFHTNSHYLSKTEVFRNFLTLLINKFKSKQCITDKQKYLEKHIDVDSAKKNKIVQRILADNKKIIEAIFITKRELTTYFVRNIQKFKLFNLIVHNYLHKHFIVDISQAPLCAKHTRLNKTQAIDLLSQQLMTSPYSLPRIFVNDPQIIWCGGKVGEIIKIDVNSEMAGKSIRYRIVVPLNGKVQTSDILDDEVVSDLEESESGSEDQESGENEEGSEDESQNEDEVASEDGDDDEDEGDADDFY